MDDVTTALVEISDDIADVGDVSVGRAATVVEVDGLSVRVKFSDEDVAGQTWYPSAVANLPVNTWGTVEPLRGNAGYFIPIGVPYFDPALFVDNAELATVLEQYATDAEVAALLTNYMQKAHSARERNSTSSPGGENLTGVGTYATAGVLRSESLQAMNPAITEGLWEVSVTAHLTAYRSVSTGGFYLYVGNGTASAAQSLARLSPQTSPTTLVVYAGPEEGLTNLTPTSVIDMRYTGFLTAGTTYVVNSGWKVVPRRIG